MRQKLAIFTFILILVVFGIKVFSSIAGQSTQPIIASGNITANVLLVSAVNAMAFVDFDTAAAGYSATDKTNFQNALTHNDLIEIRSKTNGAVIYGFARTVGSGTLGTDNLGGEITTDTTFDDDSKWTVNAGWSVSGGKANAANVAINNLVYTESSTSTAGGLYKFTSTCDTLSSGTFAHRLTSETSGATRNATGTFSDYITKLTNTARYFGINSVSTLTATFTDFSVNQVTAPSSNGLTIGNSPSATSTQNFAFKSANFTYNDPLGYSYRILSSTQYGKEIGSNTITSGTLHLDASNTAMFFHDSIDFSSYAGTDAGSTPYLLCFYDSSGYMASAYGGAVGAGESLDSELTGDATFDDDSKWTAGTGWAVSGGNATATSAAALTTIYTKSTINGNNKIYKTVLTCSGLTGGTFAIRIQAETYGTTRSGTGTFTEYITKQSPYVRAIGIAPLTTLSAIFSDFSVKLVLDVPVTGLHLYTTKNGTTRGMATQASSFNPNTITSVKIYRAY